MSKGKPAWSSRLPVFTALAFVCTLLAALAGAAPQFGVSKGQVIGAEFDGRSVADLDKAVAYYKAIGFTEVPNVDKSWRNDAVMNRIHGTKGVESRMAKFTINSNLGEQTPFTL